MRIGILGGTFDPPHAGHLALAGQAIEELQRDELLTPPAARNPLKRVTNSPAKHRLEMVRRMVEGEPKMAVSDIEISRGGVSYMVETLMELQMVKPGEYWIILGADTVRSFEKWKNPAKILKLCRLGVAIRPPMNETDVTARLTPEVRERIDMIHMKPIDISATTIRDKVSKGANISL